ncbi:MAG TPA: FmdB family zinc ribbon protein [Solirubrobacterales bacterium]|nr:FmdB family zinc ribbon protein [Solirubrobacterales bacterium]
MPIYEYRCLNGHDFEVFQRMSEDPVSRCSECGAPVERVFHPIAVHFKGSGFYTTDYKAKSKSRPGSDGASGESESGKGESGKSDSRKGSDSSSGGDKAKAASSGE